MTFMRFFTPAWRDGQLSDADYENTFSRYEERIRAIRQTLPDEATRLIDSVSLHDGLIQASDFRDGNLTLVIRCGDLQSGYSDVSIAYSGVTLLEGLPSVTAILDSSDAEIIRDEMDVLGDSAGGTFEHRYLFAPDGELRVRFTRLSWAASPVRSRMKDIQP